MIHKRVMAQKISFTGGFALLWLALAASPAQALLSGEALVHAKSSLAFADRKDWHNAQAHAARAKEPALSKLITWEYLLDTTSGASFTEISRFIQENPGWPEQKKLRLRAELSLRDDPQSPDVLLRWFKDELPVSGVGKIAFAQALLGSPNPPAEKINYLLRDAWRNGDYDENQEASFLAAYGNLLQKEDDVVRVDRLLWEGKIASAKRSAARVSGDHQKLFDARLALMEDKRDALASLVRVPSALKQDAGLVYETARYYVRHDQTDDARELLLATPDHVPYPIKWWKLREGQVRAAIDEQNYGIASKLLDRHGQLDAPEFADASWLKGWIALEFSQKPAVAYEVFSAMFDAVRFPVSKSRAAYWAGRAAEKKGESSNASQWYEKAASYPTTFYGQMAITKTQSQPMLQLPAAPSVSDSDKSAFETNELVRAIRICLQLGQAEFAGQLMNLVVENEPNASVIAQVVELGRASGKNYLSVRGAKKALQQNVVLVSQGYPTVSLPPDLPIERALAFAITRQESEFDPTAQSRAGALGMMQLMPATAKEVAKKIAVGFNRVKLNEPSYNITLGSNYLGRLVSLYGGSYVMAIAAYNAGPGNVRKWTDQFGIPGGDVDNTINWIEKIPFTETRNYVQRVLENLQVYRSVDASMKPVKLELAQDLVR